MTQNPSVLSPNSTFRQYFIYFIVCKVNLKLVLSWNMGYFA